jgi:hypothetical protein
MLQIINTEDIEFQMFILTIPTELVNNTLTIIDNIEKCLKIKCGLCIGGTNIRELKIWMQKDIPYY